jgi:hypothetical protein
VVVAYGLAAAVFVLRLLGSGLPVTAELPGAIALASIVAVPPTLAVLSARRPVLLLVAGVVSVSTLLGMSILAILLLIVGVFWLRAYVQVGRRFAPAREILIVAVPWLRTTAAFVSLFLHLDPRCTETLADGTVRQIETSDHAGWVWDAPSTSSGSQNLGPDVVSSSCSSGLVVVAEMDIAVGLAALGTAFAWRLAADTRTDS